jgi:hypothetical protein
MSQTREIEMEETGLIRTESAPLTSIEIRAQVNRIQEVMRDVMQENTHYGKVPGTPKPSLWKPGAEKLGFTFRIAVDAQIDAGLSTSDVVRYRIRAVATAQGSSVFLGAALGECSSDEEKYRWRAAVCKEEFEETPVDRRRKKWKKGNGDKAYSIDQVRTEPADIANTVLKMAVKRAEVAVILKVTAASDIFTQDIEDLPEEVQHAVSDEKTQPAGNGGGTAAAKPAQEKTAAPPDAISEPQAKRFFAIWRQRSEEGWNQDTVAQLLKDHGIANDRAIPKKFYDGIVNTVQKRTFAEYQDSKTNA